MVETAENIVAEHKNFKVNPPKSQIPTLLQVLGIPNKSKLCPNKVAEIPKIGKIPTIY